MPSNSSPTVLRRRIAAELRRLRRHARLTREEVAERLGCSPSKISRVETGRVKVTSNDMRVMLDMYGVAEPDVAALVRLTRRAHQKGWWQSYANVLPEGFDVYVGLETEATQIFTYEALLVPGLLQTAEYANAVTHAWWPTTGPSEAEQRVKVRMERQQVLARDEPTPPLFWAVVDEAALRREIGTPRIRREQLERIVAEAKRPNVEVQIVPFSSGAHASLDGAFRILTFAEKTDPPVVHLENLVGSLFLEEAHEVDRYKLVFDRLRASALGPQESLTLVGRMVEELEEF